MSEDLNFWASFIPGYAAEFAAGLTLAVLEAVARGVCRAIQGTPAERALQDAYEEGFKACLATMSPPDRYLAERYAGLFRRFVQRERVADVFAELVDVRPDVMLNLPELETEFADAGYDVKNYPGIDFPVVMRAFAVAYTDAVDRSEELHYIVEVRYLRQMVNRLTELVGPVRAMTTYTATLPDMAADLEQLVNLGQQLVTGQADQADLMRVIARVQVHRHEGQLDRIILLMQGLNSLLRDAEMARADVAELRAEVQLLRQEIDLRTERGLSPDELNQLETLYRRQMIEAHRLLTFQGMLQHNQPVALPLMDVFVSLWLTSAAQKGATPEEERLRRSLEAEGRYAAEQRMTERQREELMRRLEEMERERWERTGERLEAAKAMAVPDNQAMVLLGDPGAGKTTLMRYLALTFAEDRAVERLNLDERRLPILIPLAAYDVTLKRDEDLPLSAFLARYYETDRELPGLAPLFRQVLDEGRAIVLFDGLDEVLEASTRRLIAQRVQAFIDRYLSLGNRVILTSRIVGYQEARLPGEIPQFTVLSLSEKDIATFLHSWSLAFEARMRGESLLEVSGETVRAAQRRERGLREAVEAPSVRRLANNPLLLTILAVVYTQEGLRLPRRRVELYDRYSRILIETWNRVRSQAGRPVGKPLEFLTTAKILSALALWLQQERPSGMARGRDVCCQLRDIFLARRGYAVTGGNGRVPTSAEVDAAEREAETFLQDVREHSGLVVERGRDTYGFMHLTFQEYFAAWALAKMPTEERWRVVCPHLHDSRWREVILLTAGQIGVVDANEQEATAFVQQILNTKSHSNELLHRDELLAAACLADEIEVSAELAQNVVARVGRLLRSPFRKVAEAAGEVLGTLKETDLSPLAAVEAADGLTGEKSWMRRVAMATVAHLDSGSPEVARAVMSAIGDPDSELRSATLEGICRWEPASDEVIATVIEILEKERAPLLHLRLGPALIQWKPDDLTVRRIVEEMLVDAHLSSSFRIRGPLSRYILGSWLETEDDWEALGKVLERLMGSDDRYVRRMVIEMLVDLEQEGKMVNAVWAQALRDPDRRVREAALERLFDLEQVPEELAAGVAEMRQCEELPYLRQMADGLALKLGQLVVDEPELVDLLGSEDWQVRRVAAEVVGRLERVGPETIGALVQAVTDSDSDVQKAVREALGNLAKRDAGVVTQLRQVLREGDEEVRINVLLVLAMLQQGEADEAVSVELLQHRDWQVRQAAAEVLGRFERVGLETICTLVQALADDYTDVQQAVREALGSLARRDTRVVTQLRQALAEDDEEVRANTLLVLAALQQGEVDEAVLVELLQHRDWRVREAAAEVQGRLERVEIRPFVALVLALADSEPTVRRVAREALGSLAERDAGVMTQLRQALTEGDEEVQINALLVLALEQGGADEAALVEWLQHREWRVRQAAAEVLGRLERVGSETVGALVQALADDYYKVWQAAQEALGNLAEQDAGVVTQLRQALTEDDEEVRISALLALAAFQQGEADEAALVELLQHREWQVRQVAAEVLGRFERVGPETVGALVQALADSDSDVRKAVREVLGSLAERDAGVVTQLRQALMEGDEEVRANALLVLAALQQGEADEAALVELLQHQDWRVRQAAAEAVGRWEQASDEGISAVIETLEKERSAWLCLRLGLTLMRGNPDDPAVRSIVEEILADAYFEASLRYGYSRPPWRYIWGSWLETEDDWEALGDVLEQLMGSDNRYIRRMVIEMLADLEREGRMASAVWAEALRDPDRRARGASLKRLLDLEQVPEELATGVTKMRECEELPYLRQMADGLALKLGQLVADEPELVELLGSEDWQVRQAAVEVLGRLERVGPETLVALVQAMTDNNSTVRKAVREALGSLAKRDAGVMTQLRQALTEDDEEVRISALLALAALQQGEVDEAQLVESLQYQYLGVCRAAAEVLGQFERVGSETVGALVQALAASDSELQQAVREALGSLVKRGAGVVTQLRQALAEDDEEVRTNALLVLAALQQGEADEAALVKLLEHRDWRVRQAAAEVLERLERVGPETVGALMQALIDSDFDVRKAAQQTLTEFVRRDEFLMPVLLAGLSSINTKVRIRVAEVAGQLGEQCPNEIREVLSTMLGERRSDLKRAAAKALLELDLVDDEVTNVFITDFYRDDSEIHEQAYQSLLRIAGPECGLIVKQKVQESGRA